MSADHDARHLVELVDYWTPAGYSTVEIVARVHAADSTYAVVVVRMMPGSGPWQCPDARTLRRHADRAARRAGRSLARGVPYRTGRPDDSRCWLFAYTLTDPIL